MLKTTANEKTVNGRVVEPDDGAEDPKVPDAVEESPEAAADTKSQAPKAKDASKGRTLSISVRSLVLVLLVVGWATSLGIVLWLYLGAKGDLSKDAAQAANDRRAEKIALDYSVHAAAIDFQKLDAWKTELVKGTSPELKDKLNNAAGSMEQILVPLEWKSTATPIAAKVRSHDNNVYVVDAFIGVDTKTKQSKDGLHSTATYTVTIDPSHDWNISDVGGPGPVVGQK